MTQANADPILLRLDEIIRRMDVTDRRLSDLERRQDQVDITLAVHQQQAAGRDAQLAQIVPAVTEFHDFMVRLTALAMGVKWLTGGSIVAALAASASLLLSVVHILGITK